MELIIILTTSFQGELMSLEYHKIEVGEDELLLSPSSHSQLLDNGLAWYHSKILKLSSFSGNEATYLGDLVHNRIHGYYLGEKVDKAIEGTYLNGKGITDQWAMIECVDYMFNEWVKCFGSVYDKPSKLEFACTRSPANGLIIGGSIDAVIGDAVVDWKTSKTVVSSCEKYRPQLYSYAWILRGMGYEINNIAVVNITTYRPAWEETKVVKGATKVINHKEKLPIVSYIKEPIDEEYMERFVVIQTKIYYLKDLRLRLGMDYYEMLAIADKLGIKEYQLYFNDNPHSFRT
jgi:hypothetical protein